MISVAEIFEIIKLVHVIRKGQFKDVKLNTTSNLSDDPGVLISCAVLLLRLAASFGKTHVLVCAPAAEHVLVKVFLLMRYDASDMHL